MFCCFFEKIVKCGAPFGRNVFSLRSKCATAQNVCALRISRSCTLEQSDHIARSASHYAKRITLKIFVILQKFFKNGIFIRRFGFRSDSQQKAG